MECVLSHACLEFLIDNNIEAAKFKNKKYEPKRMKEVNVLLSKENFDVEKLHTTQISY